MLSKKDNVYVPYFDQLNFQTGGYDLEFYEDIFQEGGAYSFREDELKKNNRMPKGILFDDSKKIIVRN